MHQCLRFKVPDKSRAQRERALKQKMIECAPVADDGSVFGAQEQSFTISWRHQAKSSNPISVGHHLVPHSECFQYLQPLGRNSAATSLVSRKVVAIGQNHIANS